MKKSSHSQLGISTQRVLAVFVLCSAGVVLAMLSVAATPPLSSNAKAEPARMPLAPSTTGSWSTINSPNQKVEPTVDYGIEAVTCAAASDCWAVGHFFYTGFGVQQTLVEHWNGSTWTIVGSPNYSDSFHATDNNYLSGVTCASASDCWAVGYYRDRLNSGLAQSLTMHWDGASWSIVTSPNNGTAFDNFLNNVKCTSASQCWAVGYYNNGSNSQTLIEQWNGSSWSIGTSPNNGNTQNNYLNGLKCVSASDCWAAGSYVSVSGYNQTLIEHWNGVSWSIVSSPNTGNDQNNQLTSVACTATSDCWVTGNYTSGSGYTQTLIEHWNGASWSIVSSPNTSAFDNTLNGVSCGSASACWAVGDYINNSGIQQTLIERWNGSSWSIVTSPHQGNAQNNALNGVICFSTSECWGVGDYFTSSGVEQPLIEQWNGSSWTLATAANGTIYDSLNGVTCASALDCWAVGYYDAANGTRTTLIEHWNGSSWAIVASPNNPDGQPYLDLNELNGVTCASASNCWAVGDYHYGIDGVPRTLIEHWNGSSWVIVPSPNGTVADYLTNRLHAVICTSASDCWAVGEYEIDGNVQETLIEHWDGGSWVIVPSPNATAPDKFTYNYLSGVTCASRSNCWAVGEWTDYSEPGAPLHTLIEHWNGTSWAIVTSPDTVGADLNYLNGVTCSSASDCWAAGYYVGNHIQTLTEHWNGTSWVIVLSPNSGTSDNELNGVTCASASDCWAAGFYHDLSGPGYNKTLVEHWDGSSWSIVSSPNFNIPGDNQLSGVTCYQGSGCWAVGNSFNGPEIQTLIEQYVSPLQLISAVSRKTHGSAGAFDINLPLTGIPGIECRTGGGSGIYQVIATFGLSVTMNGASVVSGTGSVSGSTVNGTQVTINLTGVTNAQTILIRLAGVSDGTNSSNFDIPMGVLLGDTSANGSVNATDISQTKTQSGQSTTATNFREDVSMNGVINSTDVGIVKAASGTALP